MVKGSKRNPARRARHAVHKQGRVVAVVASRGDLHAAARMRRPPDLFELRLDCLCRNLNEIRKEIPALRAPLIITVRHPREGGANNLSIADRRELLAHFLPRARFIDIEMRSLPALRPLLQLARKKHIRRIISFHDLKSTPTVRTLRAKARRAKKSGATIFKVATRTDTPAQLRRLIDFFENRGADIAVSAMGIGRLGAASRLLLARRGSALNYVSLSRPPIDGRRRKSSRAPILPALTMEQLRSALSASKFRAGQGPKCERRGRSFT
jgi:3-dehydroquinate dehydratase I